MLSQASKQEAEPPVVSDFKPHLASAVKRRHGVCPECVCFGGEDNHWRRWSIGSKSADCASKCSMQKISSRHRHQQSCFLGTFVLAALIFHPFHTPNLPSPSTTISAFLAHNSLTEYCTSIWTTEAIAACVQPSEQLHGQVVVMHQPMIGLAYGQMSRPPERPMLPAALGVSHN